MTDELTIVCITNGKQHALPFVIAMSKLARSLDVQFVLGLDQCDGFFHPWNAVCVPVRSLGYPESVLEEVISHCTGEYILRIDDDETCSPHMVDWLASELYLFSDHWCFPRAWLWKDARHFITSAPFWPDHQTRLSIAEKAGGIRSIHPQSPFGLGKVAPVTLEHHKFLVASRQERETLVAKYNHISPGAGMPEFYLPEDRPMTLGELRESK